MHGSLFLPLFLSLQELVFSKIQTRPKSIIDAMSGPQLPNPQFNVVYAALGWMVYFLPGSYISIDTKMENCCYPNAVSMENSFQVSFLYCTRLHIRLLIVCPVSQAVSISSIFYIYGGSSTQRAFSQEPLFLEQTTL